MSEQEWDDLASSISRLRTAVVVLVVVIVLFCILQIISLIYKATMMRKNSQKVCFRTTVFELSCWKVIRE